MNHDDPQRGAATSDHGHVPLVADVEPVLLRPPGDGVTWADVLRCLQAGRKPRTISSYQEDLLQLQRHLGCTSAEATIATIFGQGPGKGHALVLGWINRMQTSEHLAPATINRRLAALKALADVARILGRIDWGFTITALPAARYRDTSGPGEDGVRKILDVAGLLETPRRERDQALVWMLYGRGLRIGEVLALDRDDVDLIRERVSIIGKGRREPEWHTIPTAAVNAIALWLETLGRLLAVNTHMDPRAVFIALGGNVHGRRLTPNGARHVLGDLSRVAGIPRVRPHGLRHAAVTAVLDATHGDIRAAQRFARLRNINVLQVYDDNRQDLGGGAANAIATILGRPPSHRNAG
jgi:integrase/recombinase XerC